jgi:hypothetical protein
MHNTIHVRCQRTAALIAGIVLALTPVNTAAQAVVQLDAHKVRATQLATQAVHQTAQFAWHTMPLTASQRVLAAAQMLGNGPTTVPGVRVRPSIGRNGPTASISWTARRVTGVSAESELATTVRVGLVVAEGRSPVWSLRINLARSQARAIPGSLTRRSFA